MTRSIDDLAADVRGPRALDEKTEWAWQGAVILDYTYGRRS